MVYVLTVRVMVDAGRVEGSDNIVDPLHDNINKILEERRERLSHLLRYPHHCPIQSCTVLCTHSGRTFEPWVCWVYEMES